MWPDGPRSKRTQCDGGAGLRGRPGTEGGSKQTNLREATDLPTGEVLRATMYHEMV